MFCLIAEALDNYGTWNCIKSGLNAAESIVEKLKFLIDEIFKDLISGLEIENLLKILSAIIGK